MKLKKFLFLKPTEGDAGGSESGDAADLEAIVHDAEGEEALAQIIAARPKGEAGSGEGDESHHAAGEAEAARLIEQDALSKGWTPKDKYKGTAPWVDAKTFVERGRNFAANLKNEVSSLKRQLEEFKGTAAAFKKFHDEVVAQKDLDIKEARAELKKRHREAIRDGDDDRADRIEDRLEALNLQEAKNKEDAKAVPAPTATADDPTGTVPILNDWIADGNEWFRNDPKMRAYSIEIGAELRAKPESERPIGRAFLDEVRRQMEEAFPKKFPARKDPANPDDPPPARRTIVDGSNTRGGPSSAGKTIRDLPPEDRKLCAQFVKEGWVTEKGFIQSYFERNPK